MPEQAPERNLEIRLVLITFSQDPYLLLSHSKGIIKRNTYHFTFNPQKDTSKSLKFSDYRFLIWTSDNMLMIKIKGGDFPKALSVQFALEQKVIRFHYGSDFDFRCENRGHISTVRANPALDDFSKQEDKIKLEVSKNLTFSYSQPEEVELMRTLYFQQKKLYSSSTKLNAKLPWCSLRIQLSRNEDTLVEVGEIFTPVRFNQHNNNSYFTTYSYSFVDFSSGKKYGSTRLYNPFMFNCNVLRGMTFNRDTFSSIVGNYLKILTK